MSLKKLRKQELLKDTPKVTKNHKYYFIEIYLNVHMNQGIFDFH